MATRSKRLFALCAFLMVLSFAAVSPGNSTLSLRAATATVVASAPWNISAAPAFTAAPVAKPTELLIWVNPTGADSKIDVRGNPMTPDMNYFAYLKTQFEKEHPGVTVKLEDHGWDEALRQNLLTAILGGNTPDIVVGESYFQQYAELGALVPLDDVIAPMKDNLIPGTYAGAEYNGKVYGVASFTGVFGFERNCKVIAAAGLNCDKAPQTWDELKAEAKTITEKGGGKTFGYMIQGPAGFSVGALFRAQVFLAQAGATLCVENCTKPFYNDPKALAVYEFQREMHKYTPPGLSFSPDEGQQYSQLFKDVVGYQVAGSWHVSWGKSLGCADCRYSNVPIPKDGSAASVVVGNVIYAALKQGKNPELAKEWLKFIARDDVQDRVYPSTGRLPSTRSALAKLKPQVGAGDGAFIDVFLTSKNLIVLPQWRKNPQQLWSIWNELYTKVLTTDEPIQKLMDAAQAQALDAIK